MKLIMETHRTGYSTEQVGETMTVGELIELLSMFDEDTPVYTSHDCRFTFGGISEADFDEEEADFDEEEEDNDEEAD